eukprot:CAMPEP_0185312920 /NCGR_PEP_ID=MMETSP1363-20130426/33824_1 /TAXON_ID=38817 /ORGANISM="Gephyrocapsa oceanica, Strain RCC1303" /LENGTH=55 /DNA_ID=CAMNT_0027910785 /DNA_START=72 /DNA_END=239 /DNA_ORIENTATION=-
MLGHTRFRPREHEGCEYSEAEHGRMQRHASPLERVLDAETTCFFSASRVARGGHR